jgi:hypothetical protein
MPWEAVFEICSLLQKSVFCIIRLAGIETGYNASKIVIFETEKNILKSQHICNDYSTVLC